MHWSICSEPTED